MTALRGRLKNRKFLACERGAVLVEFTLIMIPFFLLTYGVVEMARIVWSREALDDIAIRTARCMAVIQTPCGVDGVYDGDATIIHIHRLAEIRSIPLSDEGIDISRESDCGGLSDFSRVRLTVDLDSGITWLVESVTEKIPLDVTACFPNQ